MMMMITTMTMTIMMTINNNLEVKNDHIRTNRRMS